MLISSLWHQRVMDFWSFGVYCVMRFSFWSHHCTKASLEINNLNQERKEERNNKNIARISAKISSVLVRKLIGSSKDFMIFLDLIFPVSSWHWLRVTDPLSRQSPSSLFWNVPTQNEMNQEQKWYSSGYPDLDICFCVLALVDRSLFLPTAYCLLLATKIILCHRPQKCSPISHLWELPEP